MSAWEAISGFPGLENEIVKFHDFPDFPGPVRTLQGKRKQGRNENNWRSADREQDMVKIHGMT